MTEQDFITKLQTLKQIKPRKNWVVLSKTAILNSKIESQMVPQIASKASFSSILGLFSQRKLAYSMAVLLFLCVGTFGVLNLTNFTKSPAPILLSEKDIKGSVDEFTLKSKALTLSVQNKSNDVPSAIKAANTATQNLTDTLKKNPHLVSKVALEVNNNKTLLDIPGGKDLPGAVDFKKNTSALEKLIDDQEIADLEKTTLTKDQQGIFLSIKGMYSKGNYSGALVNILLLQKSVGGNK